MAKPYRTREIRWFISGELPLAVSDWFVHGLPGAWQDSVLTREDLYLLVPGRDDIGLKFRRDKIQLKLRRDRNPLVALEGRVDGMETDWERHSWTYSTKACDLVQAFCGASGEGRNVTVAKKRRQRSYNFGPGDDPSCLLLDEKPSAPVLIELTEVAFAGFSGWSLGLDVVGVKPATLGRLQQSVAGLLCDFPILPLNRNDCLDYPALIRSHSVAVDGT